MFLNGQNMFSLCRYWTALGTVRAFKTIPFGEFADANLTNLTERVPIFLGPLGVTKQTNEMRNICHIMS